MLVGAGVACLVVGRRAVPVAATGAGEPAGAGRARRPLRRRVQRGVSSPGRALAHPRAGLPRQPRRRRAVNGLAALLGGGSGRLRRAQTGFVRSYALTMLGGSVVLVAALLMAVTADERVPAGPAGRPAGRGRRLRGDGLPRAPDRARQGGRASAFSVVSLVLVAIVWSQFAPAGRRGSSSRVVDVDPAFGTRLHPRRRRHRAGDARADRACWCRS